MGETLYCSFVTLPSVAIADSEKGKKRGEEEEEEEEEDEEEDQEEAEHRRTKKKIGYAFFFIRARGKRCPNVITSFLSTDYERFYVAFLKTALFT